MENNGVKQDNTFTIVNDDGQEIKCEVLFTYEDEKTKKNYIAYTDNTLDDEVIQKYMPLYSILKKKTLCFFQLKPMKNGNL